MVILNALTILMPDTFSEIILDISAIFKLDFIAFLLILLLICKIIKAENGNVIKIIRVSFGLNKIKSIIKMSILIIS